MRTWIVTLIVALLLAGCAEPARYAVSGIASSKQYHARCGLVSDVGEVGLFTAFVEDLAGDDAEQLAGGVYATYNVIKGGQFPIGNLWPGGSPTDAVPATIPYDGYIGAYAGALEDQDSLAALVTGMRFGPIVTEYQFQPGKNLWSEASAVEDEHLLMVGGYYQWP